MTTLANLASRVAHIQMTYYKVDTSDATQVVLTPMTSDAKLVLSLKEPGASTAPLGEHDLLKQLIELCKWIGRKDTDTKFLNVIKSLVELQIGKEIEVLS